jgi:hypothetical protein
LPCLYHFLLNFLMNVGFYSGPRTLENVISYTFRRPSPAENNFLLLAFVGGGI